MKRILSLLLCIILITGTQVTPAFAAPEWPSNVSVEAEGAVLMDARSGAVIYGKNLHAVYYPASITKILTALIVILLAGTAFLFFRYLLPNLHGVKDTAPTVQTEQPVQTEAATTEPRIPCQDLSLPGGAAELTQPGYYFLLNVVVIPENTTDELVFTSGDESVATVDANGRITAVSEGKTVIYITCGDKQLTCPVTCQFEAETEPSTEATVAAQTEATIQTEPVETKPQVELKLDRTDMRLQVGYSTQLKLVDCGDLTPEDVEWSVEHAYIAKVENGYVTALQSGTTEITAKYGDQTVKCIVRCHN